MNKKLSVSLMCLSVMAAFPAVAQVSSGIEGLEEIVVTARKRQESLQEVPIAISVMGANDLKNKGVFSTSDLNNSMPGLNVTSSYGESQPNFTLRGIGVGTEYNSNAASPNGIYVDEVYQSMRASHGQQLFDLEQIEVLKGPQGTLYGRNTTGGAINFITVKPTMGDEASGHLTAGIGNYGRNNVMGAMDFTPIPGTLGIRIAGTWVDSDPWLVNRMPRGISKSNPSLTNDQLSGNVAEGVSPGGEESWGLRFSANLVTDSSEFMFKAYSSSSLGGQGTPQNQGVGDTISMARTAVGFYYNTDFFSQAVVDAMPPAFSAKENGIGDSELFTDSNGTAKIDTDGVVFNANFDLTENLSLVSITGYDETYFGLLPFIDCDGTPYAICAIGYESESESFNQDIRLDYKGDNFNMIVGAYFGTDEIITTNRPHFFGFLSDVVKAAGYPDDYFNPGGMGAGLFPDALQADGVVSALSLITPLNGTQNYTQVRDSVAIYGEGTYDFSDALSLTVGMRYTQDDFEYKDALTTMYDGTGAPRLVVVSGYENEATGNKYVIGESPGVLTPLSQKDDSSQVTGRVIVDYKMSEDVMVFASYSKGYRGGTYNGLAFQSAKQVYFVAPETNNVYELGLKSRLLDNRMQLNASLFFNDYTGKQEQLLDATATTFLVNLDAEVTGFEADMIFKATDTLTLNAAISLLDSEFTDGACPDGPLTGPVPQDGQCLNTAAGNVSVAGNPLPYAPEVTANIGFDWEMAQVANGVVMLAADAAFSDQYHFDTFGDYSYSKGDVDASTIAKTDFKKGNPSYWVANARLTYMAEGYSVSAWVKNLTDKFYYGNGINVEGSYDSAFLVRTQPRTFGVEATFEF